MRDIPGMFCFLGGALSAVEDFGSLLSPDLSRLVGWPSAGFARQLADYSQVKLIVG